MNLNLKIAQFTLSYRGLKRKRRLMNSKNTTTELVHLSRAAKILGLSSQALRNWDNAGKIKTVRSVGNHRRIPMSEINRLLGKSPDHAKTTTLVYVDVVVIEDKVDIPFEQELANDMVSLITSFSARMYGRRGGRKKK